MKKIAAVLLSALLLCGLLPADLPAYAEINQWDELKFYHGDADRPTKEEFRQYNNLLEWMNWVYYDSDTFGAGMKQFYLDDFREDVEVFNTAAAKGGNIQFTAGGVVSSSDTRGTLWVGDRYYPHYSWQGTVTEERKSLTGSKSQFVQLNGWHDVNSVGGIHWTYLLDDQPDVPEYVFGGGWEKVKGGTPPVWEERYLMLRDVTPPGIRAINYKSGGIKSNSSYVPEGTYINNSLITVEVEFDEPVDPNTATGLRMRLEGKDPKNGNSVGCRPVPNTHHTKFEYQFMVPDDINGNRITLYYQNPSDPVRDYFGRNILKLTDQYGKPLVYVLGGATFNTASAALSGVELVGQGGTRYYSDQSTNHNMRTIEFKLVFTEPMALYPTSIKGAIFEAAPGGDTHTGKVLKHIRFRRGGPYALNSMSYFYQMEPGDPEGIIDINPSQGSTSGTEAMYDMEGKLYWDLRGACLDERGGQLDLKTVATLYTGATMNPTGMQTNFAAKTEAGTYGLILQKQLSRGPLPQLSVKSSKDNKNAYTLYAVTDKTGVYQDGVSTNDLLQMNEAAQEAEGKVSLFVTNADYLDITDLNGEPLPIIKESTYSNGVYYGATSYEIAVNDGDARVSGVRVTSKDGTPYEGKAWFNVKGADITGAPLKSETTEGEFDNKPPRVTATIGQDVKGDGTTEAAVYYVISVEDLHDVQAEYRFIRQGEEPGEWTDAQQNEEGQWIAPMTLQPSETYVGTLEYRATDSYGNHSEVDTYPVSLSNLPNISDADISVVSEDNDQRVKVTFSGNFEGYNVSYWWSKLDLPPSGVGQLSLIPAGVEDLENNNIGSFEDQDQSIQPQEAFRKFDGSYMLHISGSDKTSGKFGFGKSIPVNFYNRTPQITIEQQPFAPFYYVEVKSAAKLEKGTYKIRRPGDDSLIYDSGDLNMDGTRLNLSADSLPSGYFELVAEAKNQCGAATESIQFLHFNPEEQATFTVDNVRMDGGYNYRDKEQNNILYPGDAAVESYLADMTYEVPFQNLDTYLGAYPECDGKNLLTFEYKDHYPYLQPVPYTVEKIVRNGREMDGLKGSAQGVKLAAFGYEGDVPLKLRFIKNEHDAAVCNPFDDVSVTEHYLDEKNNPVCQQGADGSYQFATMDPLHILRVKDWTDPFIYDIGARGYANAEQVYGQVEYWESVPATDADPDDYMDITRKEDGTLVVELKRNCEAVFNVTFGVEGDPVFDRTSTVTLRADDKPVTTVWAPAQTVIGNRKLHGEPPEGTPKEADKSYFGQNTIISPYESGKYPLAANTRRTKGANNYGYGRNGWEFFSDIYPVVGFALVGKNDGLDENGDLLGGSGALGVDAIDPTGVTQADIDRYQDYLDDGKLTMSRRVLEAAYIDPKTQETAFTQGKDSYAFELRDLSEFRLYYLMAKLQITPDRAEWVYVPYSYTPRNDNLVVYSPGVAVSAADGRPVPDIVFDSGPATGVQTVNGTYHTTYATTLVPWSLLDGSDGQEALVSTGITTEEWDNIFLFGRNPALKDQILKRVQAHVKALPREQFTHDHVLAFTPGASFNLIVAPFDGSGPALARFGDADYDIAYPALSTQIDYYTDYAGGAKWDGESWVSLYTDESQTTAKDLAIAVQPAAGETEFYCFADEGALVATIDPQGTAEATQAELAAAGDETLSALAAAGTHIYKKLLLRPDAARPEDPFGDAVVKAVNLTLNTKPDIRLNFRVQGTGPALTIRSIPGENGSWTLEASAFDVRSGVASSELWINDERQTMTTDHAFTETYGGQDTVTVRLRAVNYAGNAVEETKTLGYDPGPQPPQKDADYSVAYLYEDAAGALVPIAAGQYYTAVYAKITVLTEGVTIKNNGGKDTYAFLPGQDGAFVFELENDAGVTEEPIAHTMPAPADYASIDYTPKTQGAEKATITLRVLGADLTPSDVTLTNEAGAALPLTDAGTALVSGKSYRVYKTETEYNGTYTYTVRKGDRLIKTDPVVISNLAVKPLAVTFRKSIDTLTNRAVVVKASANKLGARITVTEHEGEMQELANNNYRFTTNGSVTVTAKLDGEIVVQTMVVDNIDTVAPNVTASTAYGPNNGYADVAFARTDGTDGTDLLSAVTLTSFKRLDGGFVGGNPAVGQPLETADGALSVRIRDNGVYQFTVSDAAGNPQQLPVTVDGIDDTLPEVLDVQWSYGGNTGSKKPADGYVEILEKDGNQPSNQDMTIKMTLSKPVIEPGMGDNTYKQEFIKVSPTNFNTNFVFEDALYRATDVRVKTDVLDKGYPVFTFQNSQTLNYFEQNPAGYRKEDLYDFTVGDYKDGVYTQWDAPDIQPDFGGFDPDHFTNNTFDFRKPYTITYRAADAAGNETVVERTVRLYGKNDLCVLVNGAVPVGDVAEIYGNTLSVSMENYSGEWFASVEPGRYTAAQMKTRGTPMAEDGAKRRTAQVKPRTWYTVIVRTGTMESFTFRVWAN